jgi:hypothetical protein
MTTLVEGCAVVDMNREASRYPMSEGTFETLAIHPQFFLQNMTSFDSVQGSLQGSLLTIQCEKTDSVDQISWMVVAERTDSSVKTEAHTNNDGFLITEY